MENLAFEQLDASIDTQPGDRLGILFHIKGRHDPPQRARATIAVADVLRGQPLAKPINLPSDTKIDLTLDTSLNFGRACAGATANLARQHDGFGSGAHRAGSFSSSSGPAAYSDA